jgi:Putative ABC exporter
LGGVGPVAWRQLLLAMRTSRAMIVMSVSLCAVILLGMAFSKTGGSSQQVPVTAGIGLISYLTFLFSMQAPWAFRGDIDRMDWLKMLPASSLAIAIGELVGGVLLLTSIQLVVFVATAAISPSTITVAAAAAAFCVPINTVLLASNNFLFLLYPVRTSMGASFDLQIFGRMMLSLLLQLVILLPAMGLPVLFGAVAYVAFDWSVPAFAITAWVVLVAELPVLFMGVAWAFERFDPSLHTPPED